MSLRVVVADDQALGRDRLVRLLRLEEDVEVVAACGDGEEALEAIRNLAPDAAFLDVRMPGLDGMGVVDALRGQPLPAVVLVTAHDDYAVKAFDLDAADYLLKPFSHARLRAALVRVRERRAVRSGAGLEQLLSLVKGLGRKAERPADRIAVRADDRTFFLKTESIDWIEAAGKHLQVHVGNLTHTIRGTMAGLERTLEPADFVRISRSAIVNINRILEIQPWFQGAHVVILKDRTQLTSTRRYRRHLRRLLGK
ncbi:MAG: LytR/AlgR family response regulator transcription factor [Gemmatimonadota bacterium]